MRAGAAFRGGCLLPLRVGVPLVVVCPHDSVLLMRQHPPPAAPCRTVAAVAAPRRESRVVVLAVPPRRPCLPGRPPAPRLLPPSVPLCGLASCKIHLPRAQPYVHRAKLNTTAFIWPIMMPARGLIPLEFFCLCTAAACTPTKQQ